MALVDDVAPVAIVARSDGPERRAREARAMSRHIDALMDEEGGVSVARVTSSPSCGGDPPASGRESVRMDKPPQDSATYFWITLFVVPLFVSVLANWASEPVKRGTSAMLARASGRWRARQKKRDAALYERVAAIACTALDDDGFAVLSGKYVESGRIASERWLAGLLFHVLALILVFMLFTISFIPRAPPHVRWGCH